jgi:hypothetical protein
MVSPFTLRSAGILLALVIFLSVHAPICRASTDQDKAAFPSQNAPNRTVRKADTSSHRPFGNLLPIKAAKGNIRPNRYGKVRGPFLSGTEVRQVIARAGFPAHAIPTMVQIARCESSFSVTAENVNRDGSVDFGLLQINERNWRGCHVSKAELSDPDHNARCAYQLWQRQGYGAWGCCSHT